MGKKNVMITIDEELHKKAKDKYFNISHEAEIAIRDRLNKTEIEINQKISNCEFCGIELPKQTKDDLTKGLCWLWPDEKWLCPHCLETKKRGVTVGGSIHQ